MSVEGHRRKQRRSTGKSFIQLKNEFKRISFLVVLSPPTALNWSELIFFHEKFLLRLLLYPPSKLCDEFSGIRFVISLKTLEEWRRYEKYLVK